MTGASETFSGFLAVDDFEFDTAGPPPPCTATVAPSIQLQHPEDGTSTRTASFLLAGSVTTSAPLTEANVTVAGEGGTGYTSDLLVRGSVPLAGGNFGPTRFFPLFPGDNRITVRFANCRAAREITRSVFSDPLPSTARVVVEEIEVNHSVQALDNLGNHLVELIAGKRSIARVYLRTANVPEGTLFASCSSPFRTRSARTPWSRVRRT